MVYQPHHRHARNHFSARNQGPLRNRLAGVAIAASAALVTGVSLGAPAKADGSVWDALAACESGGNWSINTGNGHHGGLQFSSSTWSAYGGERYASTASRASKSAQIATAKRVLAAQGPGAWPTCSPRAGLTRASGGADSAAKSRTSRSRTSDVSRSTSRTDRVAYSGRATGDLPVDGVLGSMTIRAIQRWVGTTQDGVFGPVSKRALQRKVGATPDGVIGPLTMAALQSRIGARQDGAHYLNPSTVSKQQAYLNSR